MTALVDRLRDLEAIVGPANLLTATEAVSQYRVDGRQPLAVAFPRTPEEVAAVLGSASKSGLSVLLRGAGRHMRIGAVPGPVGVIVSLSRLSQILDLDHENLTITAQAGTTLAALQHAAAQRGQLLPLDPAGGDEATIGGLAATNLSGPMRMRYGAPRDLIIGLRVALADGTLVKTGGKTVKNVAGYELTKFFLGSFGTLVAMCEVTVRLAPLPEKKAMVMAALAPERADEVARALLSSRLEVACLSTCNRAALERMRLPLKVNLEGDRRILFAGLMGDAAAVDRQQREIKQMLGTECTVLPDDLSDKAWQATREAAYPRDEADVMIRASVPISHTAGLLELAASWDGWWALARPGDDVVYAGANLTPFPRGEGAMTTDPAIPGKRGETSPDVLGRLREFRSAAEAAGGFAAIEAAAPDLKRHFGVWGASANVDLMRKLKESYDPRGILGCGRYLPGLE